jgi:CHAT domain-containing protein
LLRKQIKGNKKYDYIYRLKDIALYNSHLGKSEEVYSILENIPSKYRKGFDTDKCLEVLDKVAYFQNSLGNYSKAIKIKTDVLGITKIAYGQKSYEYLSYINHFSQFYYKIGNYSEAILLGTEALSICQKKYGEKHPNYASLLCNLSLYYSGLGKYSDAIKLSTKASMIFIRTLGKNDINYANTINNLALYYSYEGRYQEAIKMCTEALCIIKKQMGQYNHDYALCLNNLACYYISIGEYSQALKMTKESIYIYNSIDSVLHQDYIKSLNNLALCHSYLGNYSEALKCGTEALKIFKSSSMEIHPEYATLLNNLTLYNLKICNYYEAKLFATEALKIRRTMLGCHHPEYATSLNNLALCYINLGNYNEAIKLNTEALNILKDAYLEETLNYARILCNLGLCNYRIDNDSEAIKYCKSALEVIERNYGKENFDYAIALSNLALCFSKLGNFPEAIKLEIEAITIQHKGDESIKHFDYTNSLGNLALFYKYNNDILKFKQTWFDCINQISNNIKSHFAKLPLYERYKYMENTYIQLREYTPYFAFESNCSDFTDLCYNSVLISKGIILDTEKEFSKLIVDQNDHSLDSLVQEYRNIRISLHKLYEKPISERYVNTDSLEREASLLEHELISKSKAIGDYTHNLAIDWKQVRDSLGKRDVAVEFIKFPIPETDSVMYCALTLRQGYQKPKMIPLFEASELQLIQSHNYYTTTALSKLIWEPLDAEISGAENIYFAADGELYNIAIESLLHYDQKKQEDVRMCEKWNMYRLSSTREIAKRRSEKLPVKANQYGGLDYSADIASLEHQSKLYDNHAYTYERSVPDSLGVRGEFGPLTHTLSEVKYIDSLYKQHGIASKVYTGQDGSEPSFKHLSGQHITNLHIATHGFYWSESDMEYSSKSFMRFLNAMDEGPRYREDKAMTRTGLCLSGANAIFSDDIPDDVDDGVITAREISTLNLNGLDLVVLSACQTALGELKGDGVYGLQRGFKQAGAETIIMSLWKVDDLATMILMKEFYKCYLSGDSKRDAFMKAQNKVRTFDEMVDGVRRNFSSPKYWAAFIMLDGLE